MIKSDNGIPTCPKCGAGGDYLSIDSHAGKWHMYCLLCRKGSDDFQTEKAAAESWTNPAAIAANTEEEK